MSDLNSLPSFPNSNEANEIGLRAGTQQLRRTTSGFAVAALVFGVLGGVLGIVFGFIALGKTGKDGQRGRWMAVTGIVVPILFITAVIVGVAVSSGDAAARDAAGNVTEAGDVSYGSIRIGDCLIDLDEGLVRTYSAVPCSEPHDAEVYWIYDLEMDSYPGEDQVIAAVSDDCAELLAEHSIAAYEDVAVDIYFQYPTAQGWPGDTEAVCMGWIPGRGMSSLLADWR